MAWIKAKRCLFLERHEERQDGWNLVEMQSVGS